MFEVVLMDVNMFPYFAKGKAYFHKLRDESRESAKIFLNDIKTKLKLRKKIVYKLYSLFTESHNSYSDIKSINELLKSYYKEKQQV